MKIVTYLHLQPKLIMTEALSRAFMVWTGKRSHFDVTVTYTLYLPQDSTLSDLYRNDDQGFVCDV